MAHTPPQSAMRLRERNRRVHSLGGVFYALCNWMDLAFKATESDMWNRNTSEVRQIYINKYDDKLFLFSLDTHFLKSNVLKV